MEPLRDFNIEMNVPPMFGRARMHVGGERYRRTGGHNERSAAKAGLRNLTCQCERCRAAEQFHVEVSSRFRRLGKFRAVTETSNGGGKLPFGNNRGASYYTTYVCTRIHSLLRDPLGGVAPRFAAWVASRSEVL